MTIQIRRADERGVADFGWLDSRHSFSFGHYFDSNHMGFGPLRVINDDRVAAGGGFDTHPHRDMEIISYVIDGALEHKDSMGNGSVIRRGDVQRMSAGTGIFHSEFNASDTEPVHFLQIWIVPETEGIKPGYQQINYSDADKLGRLRLVASQKGRDGSVSLHRDADLYACLLEEGQSVQHELQPDRGGWLQVISGALSFNGHKLGEGDGASLIETGKLTIRADQDAEFLLFDIAF